MYVDHDPVAVAHSRAVLQGNDRTRIVAADLRKPQEILDSPEVAELLDMDRPVALLLVAVLHFLEDADEPYEAVARLRDALAPGSLLVLTHASYEGVPVPQEQAGGTVGVYREIRNPLVTALPRGDRPVLRRLRDGGAGPGGAAAVAPGELPRAGGSLRLLASPGGAQGEHRRAG